MTAWLPTPRLLLLAAVGGFVGFGAESVHQRAGVWVSRGDGGLPIWILVAYFVALLVAGGAFGVIERRMRPALSVSGRTIGVESALLAALFAAPALLHQHELVLAVVACGYLAIRLVFSRARLDVWVVLVVVGFDLVVEWSLVAASLYHYANAYWLPLPLWLAPLWGGLGLGLRRLFAAVRVR